MAQKRHKELLCRVDGLSQSKVDALLDHFGHGYWVAQSACRYWGEIAKIDGFSEDAAKSLFDKMQDADVWLELNDESMLYGALDNNQNGNDHAGGF